MTRVGRPRRSVTPPRRGTERIVTQIARLTMKPAAPSETPRATSIAGPKATTATRLALKQPQAKPALSASLTSRRGSRARRAGGPAALPCVRGGSRYAKAISTSPRAAADALVATGHRHQEAGGEAAHG